MLENKELDGFVFSRNSILPSAQINVGIVYNHRICLNSICSILANDKSKTNGQRRQVPHKHTLTITILNLVLFKSLTNPLTRI
jgi:hypothetical protein